MRIKIFKWVSRSIKLLMHNGQTVWKYYQAGASSKNPHAHDIASGNILLMQSSLITFTFANFLCKCHHFKRKLIKYVQLLMSYVYQTFGYLNKNYCVFYQYSTKRMAHDKKKFNHFICSVYYMYVSFFWG